MNTPYSLTLVTCHVRPSPQAVALAAGCLKSALPKAWQATAHLLDVFPSQSRDEVVSAIRAQVPRLVAFSVYVWNHEAVLALARLLRAQCPHLVLVAGGPEVTADVRPWRMCGLFDYLVLGPGERAFSRLVQTLDENGSVSSAHPVVINQEDCAAEELSSPWLEQALVPQRGVLWETARGCAFRCAYCFDGRGRKQVLPLEEGRLRRELQLFARSGVEQVWVLDSSFNVPPQRGRRLLQLMLEEAPRLHYHLEAKAEYLDRETIELLQRLNCSVQVGLQSVHASVLKRINRRLDLARFGENLFALNEAGITYGIDLIYGLPGDTLSGFYDSVEVALSFQPNQLEIFPLAVLPGTVLAQHAHRHGLRAQNHPPYTLLSSSTLSQNDMQACRHLAASIDLFYNAGRAVGYLGLISEAAGESLIGFFQSLSAWLVQRGEMAEMDNGTLPEVEWHPAQVASLSEAFVRELFEQKRNENLLPLVLDLMRFHRLWSDRLIGVDCPAPTTQGDDRNQLLQQHWQLAGGAEIGFFDYPVELYRDGWYEDLVEAVASEMPQPSAGLFFRQQWEVFCEPLPLEVGRLFQCATTPLRLEASQLNALDEGWTWFEGFIASGLLIAVDDTACSR